MSGQPPKTTRNPNKITTLPSIITFGIVLLVVAGWLGTPYLIEFGSGKAIDRIQSRIGGLIEHTAPHLNNWNQIQIKSASWSDGTDYGIEVTDVTLSIDVLATLTGRARITDVEIGAMSFHLGSKDAAFEDTMTAVNRAISPFRPATQTKPAVQSSSSQRTLPNIDIASIKAALFLQGGTYEVVSGTLSTVADEGSFSASSRKVTGIFELSGPEDFPRKMTIDGKIADILNPENLTVAFSPRIVLRTVAGDGSLYSATWKHNQLSLNGLNFKRADGSTISADSMTIKFEQNDDSSARQAQSIPGLQWLSETARRILERVHVRELVLERPQLDVIVEPERQQTPEVIAKTGPRADLRFDERIKDSFSTLKKTVEDLHAKFIAIATGFPDTRLAIHGATIRQIEPMSTVPRPGHVLTNLDLVVNKAEDGDRFNARIRFEHPETTTSHNEAKLSLDIRTGAIDVELNARRLPIHPYRRFLPSWLTGDAIALSDTVIKMSYRKESAEIDVSGTVGINDATVDMPPVAGTPMTNINVTLSGELKIGLDDGSVNWTLGRLQMAELHVPFTFEGTDFNSHPRFSWQAGIERVRAQDLLESIPKSAIQAMEGVRLGGSFAATAKMKLDTTNLDSLEFSFEPDIADLRLEEMGKGMNLELLRQSFVHRIESADGTVIQRVVGEDTPDWVALDKVPGYLISALTTSEDAGFFSHHGFSLGGIRRSIRVNLERGGFVQGASTLSQQLVKNLFLSREKTLARKLQEAFITWQIERMLEKDRILELYLNIIEWGPDVWGIGEAANHYFGKAPSDLSLIETAYLVAIIPSPMKYHEYFEKQLVPQSFMRKVHRLVTEMGNRGQIQPTMVSIALAGVIRFRTVDTALTTDDHPPDWEFSD